MEQLRDLHRVRERLQAVLGGRLPGAEAQALMSPRPRRGWRPGSLPDDCRPAAALLLLYPRRGEVHLLLTQRHADLPAHAGQVSLPGGAVEPGEPLATAALREAHEEVGLDPELVTLLGQLTPLHIPASGFHLHPFVGVAEHLGELAPSDVEVARVLEVPLEELVTGRHLHVETRELRGRPVEVPFFGVEDLKLWGATAMVLAELLSVLGAPPEPWPRTPPSGVAGDTLSDAGDTTNGAPATAAAPPDDPDTRRP